MSADSADAIVADLARSEMWAEWMGRPYCVDCGYWRVDGEHAPDCLVARAQKHVARRAAVAEAVRT